MSCLLTHHYSNFKILKFIMSKIKFLILLLALPLFFTGCDQEQDDLVTANAKEGGFIETLNPSINYIVGDDKDYTANIKVYQGTVKTTSIEVYKQFKGVLGTSESKLFKTIPVNTTGTDFASYTFNYAELREGLTAGGNPIPEDDQQLSIGDKWVLTYVATTSEGNKFVNSANTSATTVSVSTRYAGTYEVIASDYWRIGVQSGAADWRGATRTIESVDATTYYHTGCGPFDITDDERAFFYFTVVDDKISYLSEFNGTAITGLGTYFISCGIEPNSMEHVPCGDVTDYVQKDDVEGKDILYMSYGYMTTSGAAGPRVFYEVLRKIPQ